MSSPIHPTDHLDGALKYAPRRVREQLQRAFGCSQAAVDESRPRDFGSDSEPFNFDHAVVSMQRRHSLDPSIVPEPPPDLRANYAPERMLLRLCGTAAVAAVIAWAIVVLTGTRPLSHENTQANSAATSISTDTTSADALRVAAALRVEQPRKEVRGGPARAQQAALQRLPSPSAPSAATDAATPEPAPSMAQQPPLRTNVPSVILRQLDRDELRHLIKRGEDFIASGDLAAARLVLQRAAEAGDMRAALALAGTFDPNLLAELGKQELADAALARLWYQRAEQFGSAEAPARLERLATQFNVVH